MKFKSNLDTGGIDGKHFIKLKHKGAVIGAFRGDPYDFKQHWVGGRSVECTSPGRCDSCAQKIRAASRFRLNIIVKENGVPVAKIFEQGNTVYEQLRNLNAEYDLEKNLVKIIRNGSGRENTTYLILPVQNGFINPELEKAFSQVQLHDLQSASKPDANGNANGQTQSDPNDPWGTSMGPPPDQFGDIPF